MWAFSVTGEVYVQGSPIPLLCFLILSHWGPSADLNFARLRENPKNHACLDESTTSNSRFMHDRNVVSDLKRARIPGGYRQRGSCSERPLTSGKSVVDLNSVGAKQEGVIFTGFFSITWRELTVHSQLQLKRNAAIPTGSDYVVRWMTILYTEVNSPLWITAS